MRINQNFDSGNIIIESIIDNSASLSIKKDNQSDFYQWFHFAVNAEKNTEINLTITNASKSAYVEGWNDYKVCYSYDRENWYRATTQYDGNQLRFSLNLEADKVWFAYFAPYSYEQHMQLIGDALQDQRVRHEVLGETIDGHDLDLLKINEDKTDLPIIWIIARQHPGESMAEYFVEGFLDALLDPDNPLAKKLLSSARLYIVPNMNPDGSVRGHLRTNAVGVNLNREWSHPTIEKSPEVYYVREKMIETGGHLFLDVHGDEALPYNFIAASEGIPSYNKRIQEMETHFKGLFEIASPDFQTKFGYDVDEPGKANLTVGSNWMAEQFKTLAMTLEMPFKDNANLPNAAEGWSPDRCRKLGEDILLPMTQTIDKFFKE